METAKTRTNGQPDLDYVRRKYLIKLNQHTKRNVIIYATAWTQNKANLTPSHVSITNEDITGFMAAAEDLKDGSLDLILDSPGGNLDAVEALVTYLRSKFTDLRVIVPQKAMSAATMLACASNRVVMGRHSFLGPIDPQFALQTPLGERMVPAQAILDQFENAKKECATQSNLAAWLPMLNQYGPDLLRQCELVSVLSRELVEDWLRRYMFAGDEYGSGKAIAVAEWLAGHNNFKSHSRPIARDTLRERGFVVVDLEDDPKFADLVLSVHHAMGITFTNTNAAKIIENHLGKAFVTQVHAVQQVQVQVPDQLATPTTPAH